MSWGSAVHTVLSADSTLLSLLTGGVFNYDSLPADGISRTAYSSAYNATTGLLKPIVVVKGRGVTPEGSLRDANGQYISVRQVVELWFYADRDAGYTTIKSAADRAYALLQDKGLTAAFNCRLVNSLDSLRASEMQDAVSIRRDYEVIGRLKT